MSNESVIKQSIIDITSTDFVVVEKGDFEKLKQSARLFVNKVLEYYQESLRVKKIINIENLKNGLQYFYQYMRENTIFTQNILQLQHYFESQLNNFLGRKIFLAWVSENGQIKYFDETKIGQIYKKAFGQFGRGGISQSVLKNTESNINENLIKKFKESQQLRIGVYQTIKDRWLEPKNKNRFYFHGYYQNFQRRKYTRSFSNLGGIAEGYVNAVINEDEKIAWKPGQSDKSKQSSIRALYEQHISLNSIAAAIKGDVIFKESDGEIHFAVKEGQFSTAQFGQYFALAQNILRQFVITKHDFQQSLPKLIKIDDITRNILENAFQEVESNINNIIKNDLTK